MHSLVITPYILQGSMFARVLKRHNIESFSCTPCSTILHKDWLPDTDAIFFPHPIPEKTWQEIFAFLEKFNQKIPLIIIGKINQSILSQKLFKKIMPGCIFLEDKVPIEAIPEIIKDILQEGLRRKHLKRQCRAGRFKLNKRNRSVQAKGQRSVRLTRKEFYLMELLMKNAGRVITREHIMEKVWDKRSFVSQNTIDVYISRLRKKLSVYKEVCPIRTVPCLGYEFSV
jgi:hypothetical protein